MDFTEPKRPGPQWLCHLPVQLPQEVTCYRLQQEVSLPEQPLSGLQPIRAAGSRSNSAAPHGGSPMMGAHVHPGVLRWEAYA